MAQQQSDHDVEREAVELAKRGEYESARRLFRSILTGKQVPLHQGEVLRNVMLTYEREGNTAEAIATGNEILEIRGLLDTTEGVFFHGQITGQIRHLQGKSLWMSQSAALLLAGYTWGAGMGAQSAASLRAQVPPSWVDR